MKDVHSQINFEQLILLDFLVIGGHSWFASNIQKLITCCLILKLFFPHL